MSRVLKHFVAALLSAGGVGSQCCAQRVDATLHVRFSDASPATTPQSPLVVWLAPLDTALPPARMSSMYKMVQKDKQFIPHLLVVPVGSSIEFPNLDPFFHNVFSLFNGRRFDLGLYQTGQSQVVRISREGVSYIFCNIHPEMGGIILSLATPYYIVAKTGDVVVRSLPPGSYKLSVWSEQATTESMNAAVRTVAVNAQASDLGTITLQPSRSMTSTHRNKYGEPYPSQTQ